MNADSLVSASEIARLAGVTRAAVSNWRKRYADFPEPATGAGRTALFSLDDVQTWLERHRKGNEISGEVRLWQALRASYGDDMVSGIADVADLFTKGRATVSPDIRSLAKDLASESSPTEVVSGLVERFSSDRRLARAVRHFVGAVKGTVFDPACGVGSLLLSFADVPDTTLRGQEADPAAARLTMARAKLAGHPDVTVKIGDSLRDDQWPGLTADLVVCRPPTGMTGWERADLLLDPRWEFGVPTRAEVELAWLQHCHAHLAPGGRLALIMPPSVAYRPAGRRIRAEIVRRGILTHVIALPPGMVTTHPQPMHLWLLTRSADPVPAVRMIDLTENDPDDPLDPAPRQVVDVPLIDLLDETVDLTPAHHIAAARDDYLTETQALRDTLSARLRDLLDLLPPVTEGPGTFGVSLRIADMIRAGLVDLTDDGPVSTTDQLDTDFLRGFLRSTANTRRSTSTSGSFRLDARSARVPQMDITDQRLYGAAFRDLDAFERRVKEVTALSERLIALTRDGLTNGSLRPDQLGRN